MALKLGIDIGSKTIKSVVLDEHDQLLFSSYELHYGRVADALHALLERLDAPCAGVEVACALTGSGTTGLAQKSGVEFVQEVLAAHRSITALHPEADAFIELGGEDAKLVYLRPPVEHRMNTSCAGGTGSFIEDVAQLLGEDMAGLDALAAQGEAAFSIASRCAVFATRDLKPLLSAGKNRADIAASAYQAVVNQTLGTLACGRPVKGTVLFLGGPMEHLPALVERFRRSLKLEPEHAIKPQNAQVMSAWGAALSVKPEAALPFEQLEALLRAASHEAHATMATLPPLGGAAAAAADGGGPAASGDAAVPAAAPAAEGDLPRAALAEAELPLYMGLDAGSTTMKMAVIDAQGRLVHNAYNGNPGDASAAAQEMLAAFRERCKAAGLDAATAVARTVACGYGEQMLVQAAGADDTMAETAAHLRGALAVFPQVSFVLDIGGQDMKALWVKDGQLAASAVNETCSSGCGAFMSNAAQTLGMSLEELDQAALKASAPVDLGARCTVFMRSCVRHAQEQGCGSQDIAAGAAYSVANNALRRLIGTKRIGTLGDFIVVQGGAFASDAVLRAFEHELGHAVHRSPLSPLMGAIGAAFTAREQAERVALEAGRGSYGEHAEQAPNTVAYQQELLRSYGNMEQNGPRGALKLGLIAAMNDYESLPFWHTCLTRLGFSLLVPSVCEVEVSQPELAETLVSDMVCLPAQLMHKHALKLAHSGASCIFAPSSGDSGLCCVTREYSQVLPDALKASISIPVFVPLLSMFSPRKLMFHMDNPRTLCRELNAMLDELAAVGAGAASVPRVSVQEIEDAVAAGRAELERFTSAIIQASDDALAWTHERPERRAVLLSGRGYHTAPELLNGIDRILNEEGFAVIGPLGLAARAREARTRFMPDGIDRNRAWVPAKHMLGFAALAVSDPQLELVCLQSFGCGLDAVSLVDVQRMLEANGRIFTVIKLDSKADAAHTRIRVRALADAAFAPGALHERPQQVKLGVEVAPAADDAQELLPFSGLQAADLDYAQRNLPSDICATAALIAAYAVRQARANPSKRIALPAVCELCIADCAQHFVTLEGLPNNVEWVSDWPHPSFVEELPQLPQGAPRIGLCGNPLLLFDPVASQDLPAFIRAQGVQPVYPTMDAWYADGCHYLSQLDSLQQQGVTHVLMLQNFLCLKAHVHVRGAMGELRRRYPGMRFTVIDIDTQASALNVRNRVLLALESLRD